MRGSFREESCQFSKHLLTDEVVQGIDKRDGQGRRDGIVKDYCEGQNCLFLYVRLGARRET